MYRPCFWRTWAGVRNTIMQHYVNVASGSFFGVGFCIVLATALLFFFFVFWKNKCAVIEWVQKLWQKKWLQCNRVPRPCILAWDKPYFVRWAGVLVFQFTKYHFCNICSWKTVFPHGWCYLINILIYFINSICYIRLKFIKLNFFCCIFFR